LRPDQIKTTQHRKGFTLLETLVALGIVAILVATLVPISRNTRFEIVALRDEARRLNVLSHIVEKPNANLSTGRQLIDGMQVEIKTRALPAFEYDKTQATHWQPILVTVNIQSPSGAFTRSEFIRLEREGK
jgi:prepilin-type N-terminal cleavage/methylation domain-containing protein